MSNLNPESCTLKPVALVLSLQALVKSLSLSRDNLFDDKQKGILCYLYHTRSLRLSTTASHLQRARDSAGCRLQSNWTSGLSFWPQHHRLQSLGGQPFKHPLEWWMQGVVLICQSSAASLQKSCVEPSFTHDLLVSLCMHQRLQDVGHCQLEIQRMLKKRTAQSLRKCKLRRKTEERLYT